MARLVTCDSPTSVSDQGKGERNRTSSACITSDSHCLQLRSTGQGSPIVIVYVSQQFITSRISHGQCLYNYRGRKKLQVTERQSAPADCENDKACTPASSSSKLPSNGTTPNPWASVPGPTHWSRYTSTMIATAALQYMSTLWMLSRGSELPLRPISLRGLQSRRLTLATPANGLLCWLPPSHFHSQLQPMRVCHYCWAFQRD